MRRGEWQASGDVLQSWQMSFFWGRPEQCQEKRGVRRIDMNAWKNQPKRILWVFQTICTLAVLLITWKYKTKTNAEGVTNIMRSEDHTFRNIKVTMMVKKKLIMLKHDVPLDCMCDLSMGRFEVSHMDREWWVSGVCRVRVLGIWGSYELISKTIFWYWIEGENFRQAVFDGFDRIDTRGGIMLIL